MPESYMLACSSLIPTYILFIACLKNKELNLGLWVLAGLFSFGITITNFAQTLICFVTILFYINHEFYVKRYVLATLGYVGSVITCSIFLSIIQNKLYGSDYFFMPSMVVYETKSFITEINLLTHPLSVIGELLKHFFLVNFVAMQPAIINSYISETRQLSFFRVPLSYSYLGFTTVLLWVCLFVTGIRKNIISCVAQNSQEKTAFLSAISLSILFNMALHSLYGTVEMFIYTGNFTFLVLLLLINNQILRRSLFTIGLGVLISLMAVNNLTIFLSFQGYSFAL